MFDQDKAKTKILYIITKSVWGGAGKYVYDLAAHLPKDEFEIYVAAGPAPEQVRCGVNGQGHLFEKLKAANIPYFEIRNFQRDINILKEFFAFFEVLRIIKKIKPDVIHANSSKAGGIAGIVGWLYKLLTFDFGLLTIFTAHGWGFNERRPSWQLFLIRLASKLTALFCNKIICVSEYDRRSAIKNRIVKPEKLIVIHNGIDLKNSQFLKRREAQEKLLGKTSFLVIGTIAEWAKNKGLFRLLKAAGQITESKFDLVLIGSGENPDKDKMYNFVKKYNLKNIYLHEFIPNAASYLKALDIFVLPSIKEGLPYTILEAGLAELSIVASRVGGIPEIITDQENGFLVSPGDPEEIARAIEKLIENPGLRAEFGRKAKEKILQEFSLEKMLEKTMGVYKS
jgi:glycosyltransferase involved in cell wall biosynthesis